MPFIIRAYDKPDSAALRAETRQAHLAYLAPHAPRVLAGGALLSDDGSNALGSLIIFDTEDRAEAEALAANDPYAQAGLFERVEILRWRKVLFAGAVPA